MQALMEGSVVLHCIMVILEVIEIFDFVFSFWSMFPKSPQDFYLQIGFRGIASFNDNSLKTKRRGKKNKFIMLVGRASLQKGISIN